MILSFFWIDAFSDKAFGGNPAAVVPLESWLEDALKQRIAGWSACYLKGTIGL